ncbi:MAG: LURP-one-related family protein [Anaerolineae bacterium]
MRGRREERREERRDDRGPGGGVARTHYKMRQQILAIGDDFWIENDRGERVYKIDGKALRIRKTLIFEDRDRRELAKIQERMLRVKDSMEIEGEHGERVAMVKKALITPVRERWTVRVKDGPDLEVQGNILDHEYTIGEGRDKVAEVSKKWFRVADTYGIEVEPGQDDVVILAIAVAIDMMAHPQR